MGRQIKGLLYFYRADLQFSFFVFWTILLVMLAISVSMMHLFPVEFMTFSLTGPVYVYCAIIAFLMARHNVPAALKFSSTRKNIYVSSGIFFIGMAILQSVIASLLTFFVNRFLLKEGMNLYFIHPMYFAEDSFINRVYTDIFIILFIATISYFVSLLFYRLGLLISGLIVGILFVACTYSIISTNVAMNIVESFQNNIYWFFGQLGMIAIVVYGISWLLLRKITVVPKK